MWKTLLPSSNRFFQIEDPLFDIVSQGGITTNTTTLEHHKEVLSTANVLGLSPRETDVLLNVISKNQAANVTEIVEEETTLLPMDHDMEETVDLDHVLSTNIVTDRSSFKCTNSNTNCNAAATSITISSSSSSSCNANVLGNCCYKCHRL